MKKTIAICAVMFLLSACGAAKTTAKPESTPSSNIGKVPMTCNLDAVNSAFAKIIPTSKYIDTKWKPAAGTDLFEAINGGGIACSYGDQNAEIGGTVMWTPNMDGIWDSRVMKWTKDGMIKIDIPNVNEEAAYMLPDGSTSADGMPAWRVNLLINGIWIQLGAAFIQSWDEATPIIDAAITASN